MAQRRLRAFTVTGCRVAERPMEDRMACIALAETRDAPLATGPGGAFKLCHRSCRDAWFS